MYAEGEVSRKCGRDGEKLLLVGCACIPSARINEEECGLETEDGGYLAAHVATRPWRR